MAIRIKGPEGRSLEELETGRTDQVGSEIDNRPELAHLLPENRLMRIIVVLSAIIFLALLIYIDITQDYSLN